MADRGFLEALLKYHVVDDFPLFGEQLVAGDILPTLAGEVQLPLVAANVLRLSTNLLETMMHMIVSACLSTENIDPFGIFCNDLFKIFRFYNVGHLLVSE